jgi:hypothetical protein
MKQVLIHGSSLINIIYCKLKGNIKMDHNIFRNMYLLLSVFKLLSNRSYNEKEE